MSEPHNGTPAWVDDILSFGHNIGLALALAGFSALVFHLETVRGPENWNRYLAMACLVIAAAWGFLSTNQLAERLLDHTRLRSKTWARVTFGGLAIGLGTSVVLLASLMPDNNHIVSLCDKYANAPDDKIHNSAECQRLYARRTDYERRLRGEQTTTDRIPGLSKANAGRTQQGPASLQALEITGGRGGNRTPDTGIFNFL